MGKPLGKILGTSTPKYNAPEPLPPAPERSDAETAALAEEQRKKYASAGQGRAGTFLTAGGTTQGFSAVRYLGGAGAT